MSANEKTAEPAEGGSAEPSEGEAVSPQSALEMVESGAAELIDVRTAHEWEAGHVPGARHLLLTELKAAAAGLPKDQPLLICCRAGNRSEFAAASLRAGGFDARPVAGGALAWAEQGLPLEPKGGYVAESGEAAAELEARERAGERKPGIPW